MTTEIPTKRRRGGQPGNQNAKGNRGNRHPRRNRGNRGGGAPLGNQNARKRRPPAHMLLLQKFEHDPEAAAWIRANATVLDEAGFKEDDERDPALYNGFVGLTPEALAARGVEYRLGIYSSIEPEPDQSDGDEMAA